VVVQPPLFFTMAGVMVGANQTFYKDLLYCHVPNMSDYTNTAMGPSVVDVLCAPSEGPTSLDTMGLWPLSGKFTGNLFLMACYGFILAKGSKMIADGSELLMEVLYMLTCVYVCVLYDVDVVGVCAVWC